MKMVSFVRANKSINIFHAVGISIAAHLIFLSFLPNMQSKTPPVPQKKYEKVKLEIIKRIKKKPLKKIQKKPVVQKPTQPVSIKKQYSKIPIMPVPVKMIQNKTMKAVNAMVMRPTTHKLNNTQLMPLRANTSPSNLTKLISHPTNQYRSSTKPGKQNRLKVSPIYKSPVRNAGAVHTPYATRAISTNVATLASPGLRPQIKKISTNIGGSGPVKLVRGNIARNYMARSFTPMSRPVEKLVEPELNTVNSLSGEEMNKIWGEYTNSIQLKIAKAKIYPAEARDKGQQGKAFVTFKLSQDGKVLGFSIENSSGHNILDHAAIQAIKDGAPYPHIPDKLNKKYASLKIPISFILR